MTMFKLYAVVIVVLAVGCTPRGASKETGDDEESSADVGVEYPSEYRTWNHVKSMVVMPGHALDDPFGGIHHVYANPKAMDGLTGGEYQDGAVFVFDLLGYDDSNKMIVETARKRIDVMQYDPEQFAATGGWGYDTFVGDSTTERLDQDVVASCFGCHTSMKDSNYVFSKYRP